MFTEVVQAGGLVGAVLVLRQVTQLIVIIWSLRADDAGRKHARQVLELLRGHRRPL